MESNSAPPPEPVSLYGLWKGVSISEEEIAEAHQEMWGNFPRDDSQSRSLRGLWADLGSGPTAEEIDVSRREMLGNFPREDVG